MVRNTVSLPVGTWAEDQLAALFQSPLTAAFQLRLAADRHAGRRITSELVKLAAQQVVCRQFMIFMPSSPATPKVDRGYRIFFSPKCREKGRPKSGKGCGDLQSVVRPSSGFPTRLET